MSDYQLANPPIFDTDLPTNEQWYTHVISGTPASTSTNYTTFYGYFPPPMAFVAPTWSGQAARYGNTVAELRSANPALSALYPDDRINGGYYQAGYNYLWVTPGFAYLTRVAASPPPAHNFNYKYAPDAPGIVSLAHAPVGHATKGIYALYETWDGSYNATPALRLAFHPRGPGGLRAYMSGWQLNGLIASNPVDVTTQSARIYGILAAQRLGDYVYVFSWASQTKPASYYTDASGSTHVGSYSNTGHFAIGRINPSGALSSVYTQVIEPPHIVPMRGLDYPADRNLGDLYGSRQSTFVSDDAVPFIWHTSGDISRGGAFVERPINIGFADNGTPPGYLTQDGRVAGQIGAFAQMADAPDGNAGFGPYLVHPWSSGNYGPPELWFFMQVGFTGSTFDIYRAQWKRHQFVHQFAFDDDPDYETGARSFPTGNPDGWAFEHNWHNDAHKVGRVGPFPGAQVFNPINPAPGGDVLQPGQILYPYFSVLRDRKRIGQMHIVMMDSGTQKFIA